jgi:hypothetical protein
MNVRQRRILWVVLAAVAVVGCSDLGAPLRLFPRADVSVSALGFGTVAVGGSASRSVTVGNSGEADLHGLAAVSCPEFGIESGGGAFTVPPGGVHSVVVRYTPAAVQPATCELTLGEGLASVALAGAGSPTPVSLCVASVSALDFGLIAVGGSRFAVFKLYSRGTAAVAVNVVAPCSQFSLVGGGGAQSLLPGDSLVVTLLFAPSVGGHSTCTIGTGPGCPDVTLSGDATSVSFATQVLPILNANFCSGCHSILMQQASDLVNVPSEGYPGAVRIKPFDLVGSVLYGKITGARQYGTPMPLGRPGLPPAESGVIRTWILEGAHNN